MFSARARLRLPVLFALLHWASLIAQNPVYVPIDKAHRAEVKILILSTAVHQGFAGSEEVYLAEVSFGHGSSELAKLVDSFSSTKQPIRRVVLLDRRPLKMILTRRPECDSVGRDIFIGRNENIFDPGVLPLLKERALESIPCFTVDHDATRIAK